MSITEVTTFIVLAGVVLATQLGRHQLTLRRMILPLLIVAGIGYKYLQGIPTAGGDLDFEIICALAGVACGLLAAGMVRLDREALSGRIITVAGTGYAAVWLVVLGGRLAFGWGASNIWQHQVMQFSMDHAITGSAAWTAAFVLMALAMVGTRTVTVGLRALPLFNGTRQHLQVASR
jgi:hypothetical protein